VNELYTIGLTGAVGSGKSSVLSWLAERGAATLDADGVVRELLGGDDDVIDSVVARFGDGVLAAGGGIDRAALADIVFDDPEALAALEGILHPAVDRWFRQWLSRVARGVAVVEAVKLVQSGMHRGLDELWVVTCRAPVRRRRLRERGWSSDEIERRMAASPPEHEALALADVVIDNSGTLFETERQLESEWRRLFERAGGGVP
jgi:dephospho-CoA kinase